MSMCAGLPIAYREQLGEERKELVVPPEYETSPPGASGPGFSFYRGTSCQGMAWQERISGVRAWRHVSAHSTPAIVLNAEDAKRKL